MISSVVLDGLPAQVAMLDQAGTVVLANAAWLRCDSCGPLQNPAYVVGANYLRACDEADGVGAADAHTVAAGIRSVLAGDCPIFTHEYPSHTPDQERWFNVMVTPVASQAQRGVVVTHVNITDRHAMLRALRDTQDRQAALIEQAHDAIIVRSLDDHIVSWNQGAVRLFGWQRDEAVGRRTLDLFDRESEELNLAKQHLLTHGFWEGELEKYHRGGHKVLVAVRWSLMRRPDGVPDAVLSIATDITERRRIEAQLLRAQRLESLGTMAGGVAHDLNNVLAPILMSIEVLKDKVTDDDGRSLLETLETSSHRGAELVRQMLSFARGVEGRRIPVDLAPMVDDMARIVRETFPKGIQLKLKCDTEVWPVPGDPTQLRQVLMNLCVNARDAMPQGGVLTLGLARTVVDQVYAHMNPEAAPGPYVVLKVTDTGDGIPPDIRERIFEPFFTTKEVGKGTGLGLSTTFAIVKSHRGFINLYSEVGKGTTFKVYLPATTTAEAADLVAVEQSQLPRGNGELILLVDDEAAIREVAERALTRFGYRVLCAAHGAEAVSLYARQGHDIAVVVTDMAMPIMDGPSMIIALKSINPEIRIIGSSGLTSNDGMAKAVGAGVQHFVPKPYTADTLLRTLAKVLAE